MSCVVRNISPEGAAIDVENPAFVPARFRLVMANGAIVHECSIAWMSSASASNPEKDLCRALTRSSVSALKTTWVRWSLIHVHKPASRSPLVGKCR